MTVEQIGEPLRAAGNVVGSVLLGLLAARIDYILFSALLQAGRN